MSDEDKKVIGIALNMLYSTIENLERDGICVTDYGYGIDRNTVFNVADRLGIEIH